ncbi:MFS transporter [Novosphingobium sp. 9]|uniref:MFS transporter n=1 Tax=Novosphingobium sp. 9 TaxID=2025349 RepID=UPI0021B6379B|nr:MFS transporter [Novosphingobium sp. 9]
MTALAARPAFTPPVAEAAVPTSVVLRYGVGQLGAQVFRDTPAVLLPLFMTTMLGIPAWMSGFVVLIPKLWLIACDPLTGAWSDRIKDRYGRTPFLLVGAVLTSLAFVALFNLTATGSPLLSAMLTCFIFFVGSTAFSAFSVPYLAVASGLSRDPHQRTRIMVFRMVFASFGVLAGVGSAQPLVYAFGGGARGWLLMSLILGALCLVTMLATAIGMMRVPLIRDEAQPTGLLRQLGAIGGNRPYLVLLSTCLIQNVAQACGYTVIGFIFLYALKAIWLVPLFIIAMTGVGIVTQPVWLTISRRLGKERAFVLASLVWGVVTASWWFIHPSTDVLMTLPGGLRLGTQDVLVMVRGMLIGLTNGAFIMLGYSMLTDTIDLERRRHGIANEGVFSGLFSAFEKLSFAVGPVIAGLVMSAFGFASSTGGAAAQSVRAVTGIVMLYSWIPAGLMAVSLIVFTRYRLPQD